MQTRSPASERSCCRVGWRRQRLATGDRAVAMCRRIVSHSGGGTRPSPTRTKNRSRASKGQPMAGCGRFSSACPYGGEGDRGRNRRRYLSVDLTRANRPPSIAATHIASAARHSRATPQQGRLRRLRPTRPVTGAPRCMQPGRGDSPGMCAMSVMVSSAAHAGNATPCVPRRQFPASVTRRGCAAHPRDGFRRPSAESDREPANRCAVFPDAANAATNADRTDRDASGRRWLAEPAAARSSTAATPCARTATADGRVCETADSTAPGRPTGGAGQASREAGRDAPRMPIGSRSPPDRYETSGVAWPAITPTSTTLARCDFGEAQDNHAAGIDVGNSTHYVAVRPDRDPDSVRRFECFTADLHRLADWLQHCGVTTVAMQSTGVYWIPVYEILDARGIEVYLVNARHTKNLPGRKTDVQESQWLLKLHTYGLLRNSFHPSAAIRVVRT